MITTKHKEPSNLQSFAQEVNGPTGLADLGDADNDTDSGKASGGKSKNAKSAKNEAIKSVLSSTERAGSGFDGGRGRSTYSAPSSGGGSLGTGADVSAGAGNTSAEGTGLGGDVHQLAASYAGASSDTASSGNSPTLHASAGNPTTATGTSSGSAASTDPSASTATGAAGGTTDTSETGLTLDKDPNVAQAQKQLYTDMQNPSVSQTQLQNDITNLNTAVQNANDGTTTVDAMANAMPSNASSSEMASIFALAAKLGVDLDDGQNKDAQGAVSSMRAQIKQAISQAMQQEEAEQRQQSLQQSNAYQYQNDAVNTGSNGGGYTSSSGGGSGGGSYDSGSGGGSGGSSYDSGGSSGGSSGSSSTGSSSGTDGSSSTTDTSSTSSDTTASSSTTASQTDQQAADAYVAQHPEAKPYEAMVLAAATKYGVPAKVLFNQIGVESSWNPNAVNSQTGATGLTQFISSTWTSSGYGTSNFADAKNPELSIEAQAKYMSALMQQNGGSVEKALMEYNGWDTSKSYSWNISQGYDPNYVSDILGESYTEGTSG